MSPADSQQQKVDLRAGQYRRIYSYFGLIYLMYGLGNPATGVANIPIQFLLKDQLHLNPNQLALFQFFAWTPMYVACMFGFIRDRWSPFGMRDRGYFLLFGPLTALAFAILAFGSVSYAQLLAGVLFVMIGYRFLAASVQALTAVVGQQDGLTGRLSAAFNIIYCTLLAISSVLGGWLDSHAKPVVTFGLLAALMSLYVIAGLWRPREVFDGAAEAAVEKKNAFAEMRRAIAHRPLWPAAIIWLLWSFAPGFATPLLFYLTKEIKCTSDQFGLFMGLFNISFLPTLWLYGWLCARFEMKRILFWSTLVAIPQMMPLIFIHSPAQALWLAPLLGLMGGVATGAYFDLILRASPPGLEGAAVMVADAGYYIAVRYGDLFGTWLYQGHGFSVTAWVTTAVYVLILPVLLWIPSRTLAYREGFVGQAS